MKLTSRIADTRPCIWAVGMSRLGELFQDLLPGFEAQAKVRLVTLGFDEAVAEIGRARTGEVDVIVAAGSNGAYLRSRVGVPVVLVNASGSDALQALSHARRISPKVGLVSHGDSLADFARFAEVFGLEIPHRVYQSTDEARAAVVELRDLGVKIVVGPGLVTEIAEREGMASVFLYSRASVEAAVDTALEIARGSRVEASRRERLDAVLRHLRDGVVATDTQWRVQAINQAMTRILGVTGDEVLGKRLQEISPSFDWLMLKGVAIGAAQGDGQVEADNDGLPVPVESIQTIEGKSYAVTRVEVIEQGVRMGFVTTFQETGALQRMDRSLRSRHRPGHLVARYSIDDLLGDSKVMADVRELALRYAQTDATVLILGETGTGKEIVAQGIHAASERREYPFVAVNCGAFPESLLESELFGYEDGAFTGARRGGKAGLIETAHGGTLFLDEIAEMPLTLQTRLLRVLQEREVIRIGAVGPTGVDLRVIAATHQQLDERVDAGLFRRDLFFRLNILPLILPTLRERADDIPQLAKALLTRALGIQQKKFPKHDGTLPARKNIQLAAPPALYADADAVLAPHLEALVAHTWSGNVRELENFIERLCLDAGKEFRLNLIDGSNWKSSAPPRVPNIPRSDLISLKQNQKRNDMLMIKKLLTEAEGDRDEVCRILRISRSTLWRKLQQG
jgi:propionate catabolism operon transcriptional regulator